METIAIVAVALIGVAGFAGLAVYIFKVNSFQAVPVNEPVSTNNQQFFQTENPSKNNLNHLNEAGG